MPTRVQIILDEQEAARFKSQARKESKSLSAWLREAGRKMLEKNDDRTALTDPRSLKAFFRECNFRETGTEPDWMEHKAMIHEGFQSGKLL